MKEIIYNMPAFGRCYDMRIGGHISSDTVTKKKICQSGLVESTHIV